MTETKTRTIFPLEDRIVVVPEAVKKESDGGIIIPDAAQERPVRGTVVHVGPGKTNDDGSIKPMNGVKEGDLVVYGLYSGTEVEVDGAVFVVMYHRDVLGIVR